MKTFAHFMRNAERALVFVTLIISSSKVSAATPIASGTYHMSDVGCTNPNYKYSPDEQAMIDAVHHMGTTWSDDDVVLSTETSGVWTTLWSDDGLGCRTLQDFALTYDASGAVSFSFTNSRPGSPVGPVDPNKSISCEPVFDAVEKYQSFEITPAGFDLINGGPADPCGGYRLHFQRVK